MQVLLKVCECRQYDPERSLFLNSLLLLCYQLLHTCIIKYFILVEMIFLSHLTLFAIVFLFGVRAFNIDFNVAPACDGWNLGQWTGVKDGICRTNYAGTAAGYSVTSSGPSDIDNLVVFYSSDDCDPSKEIAASNVELCTTGKFSSFKVVEVKDCCLDSAVSDCILLNNQASNQSEVFDGGQDPGSVDPITTTSGPSAAYTSGLDSPLITDTAGSSINPSDLSVIDAAYPSVTDSARLRARGNKDANPPNPSTSGYTVYHGAIRTYGEQTYKMHQIAHEVYRGINIEDWDDSVHTPSDTKIDFSGVENRASQQLSGSVSSRELSPLEERAFRWSQCNGAMTCLYQIGTAVVYGINGALDFAVAAWNQLKAHRQSIWTFLNQPIVVGVGIGGPLAAFQGYISARTTTVETPPAECSSSNDDGIMIREAVYGATLWLSKKNGDLSDLAVTLTLKSGEVATIVLNARQTGETTPEVCGAPTTA